MMDEELSSTTALKHLTVSVVITKIMETKIIIIQISKQHIRLIRNMNYNQLI